MPDLDDTRARLAKLESANSETELRRRLEKFEDELARLHDRHERHVEDVAEVREQIERTRSIAVKAGLDINAVGEKVRKHDVTLYGDSIAEEGGLRRDVRGVQHTVDSVAKALRFRDRLLLALGAAVVAMLAPSTVGELVKLLAKGVAK